MSEKFFGEHFRIFAPRRQVVMLHGCMYARFYVRAGGQLPPKRQPCSLKCDIKHCLTNSKHRHIGAKRSVRWTSDYAKMCFRPGDPTGELKTLPRPPVALGGDTAPSCGTLSMCHILARLGPRGWGPQIVNPDLVSGSYDYSCTAHIQTQFKTKN